MPAVTLLVREVLTDTADFMQEVHNWCVVLGIVGAASADMALKIFDAW